MLLFKVQPCAFMIGDMLHDVYNLPAYTVYEALVDLLMGF